MLYSIGADQTNVAVVLSSTPDSTATVTSTPTTSASMKDGKWLYVLPFSGQSQKVLENSAIQYAQILADAPFLLQTPVRSTLVHGTRQHHSHDVSNRHFVLIAANK
eukprot:PhF_6_TR13055/c0_g1_i2/m.20732